MRKFKITAVSTTWYVATIEAEDIDKAQEIADEMDGGEFQEEKNALGIGGSWDIDSVDEIKPDNIDKNGQYLMPFAKG